MRKLVARKELVSAFTGQYDFVSGLLNGTAQPVAGGAVCVVTAPPSMFDCRDENVGEIRFGDRYGQEIRAHVGRGPAGSRTLIEVVVIERHCKGGHLSITPITRQTKDGR